MLDIKKQVVRDERQVAEVRIRSKAMVFSSLKKRERKKSKTSNEFGCELQRYIPFFWKKWMPKEMLFSVKEMASTILLPDFNHTEHPLKKIFKKKWTHSAIIFSTNERVLFVKKTRYLLKFVQYAKKVSVLSLIET